MRHRYGLSNIFCIEWGDVISEFDWVHFFTPGVGVSLDGRLLMRSGQHATCGVCCVCVGVEVSDLLGHVHKARTIIVIKRSRQLIPGLIYRIQRSVENAMRINVLIVDTQRKDPSKWMIHQIQQSQSISIAMSRSAICAARGAVNVLGK